VDDQFARVMRELERIDQDDRSEARDLCRLFVRPARVDRDEVSDHEVGRGIDG
jgi:hypothetical protein